MLAIVDQLSQLVGRTIRVVVEIKHDQYFRELNVDLVDLVDLLLAELADTGWLDRPELLTLESFEFTTLLRLRERAKEAFLNKTELIFLSESSGVPADEVAALLWVPAHRARDYAWFRSNVGLDLLAQQVQGISVSKRNILDMDAEGECQWRYGPCAAGPRSRAARVHVDAAPREPVSQPACPHI